MILDALLKLSAAQQVTADADTTNSIDLGNLTVKRDASRGEPMCLIIAVKAAGTNTGSIKFLAIQSAADTLSSPQILGEVDLAAADLVAGARIKVPIGGGIPVLRYLGGRFDITGTVDVTVDVYLEPSSMASLEPIAYTKGYVNA